MLVNVYAALVAQHGFTPDAKTQPDGTEGNVVWLHLFIDALAIQPCNPTCTFFLFFLYDSSNSDVDYLP